MKHKLMKLIAVMVIAVFALQGVVFAQGHLIYSLRPMAVREQKDTEKIRMGKRKHGSHKRGNKIRAAQARARNRREIRRAKAERRRRKEEKREARKIFREQERLRVRRTTRPHPPEYKLGVKFSPRVEALSRDPRINRFWDVEFTRFSKEEQDLILSFRAPNGQFPRGFDTLIINNVNHARRYGWESFFGTLRAAEALRLMGYAVEGFEVRIRELVPAFRNNKVKVDILASNRTVAEVKTAILEKRRAEDFLTYFFKGRRGDKEPFQYESYRYLAEKGGYSVIIVLNCPGVYPCEMVRLDMYRKQAGRNFYVLNLGGGTIAGTDYYYRRLTRNERRLFYYPVRDRTMLNVLAAMVLGTDRGGMTRQEAITRIMSRAREVSAEMTPREAERVALSYVERLEKDMSFQQHRFQGSRASRRRHPRRNRTVKDLFSNI